MLGYGATKAIGMGKEQARAITFEIDIEMSRLAVVLALVCSFN